MNKIIIPLSIMCLQISCMDTDKCHRFITYKNNSTQNICFIATCDTLLSSVKMPYGETVNATSEGGEHLSATCSEGVIGRCPNEKITYFFIDANLKNSTSWDTIRLKNKYLHREILSVSDLSNRNWIVTYP